MTNSCWASVWLLFLSHPQTIITLANKQQILSIPKKVQKNSNDVSSPMLTDANGIFLSSSAYRIFLSHASAKPYHLFKKDVTECNKDITDNKQNNSNHIANGLEQNMRSWSGVPPKPKGFNSNPCSLFFATRNWMNHQDKWHLYTPMPPQK